MEAQKLRGTAENNIVHLLVCMCVCVEGWECDNGAEIDLGQCGREKGKWGGGEEARPWE